MKEFSYWDVRLLLQKRLFKLIQIYSFESAKLFIFISLFCLRKRLVIIFEHMHLNVIIAYKYMHKKQKDSY